MANSTRLVHIDALRGLAVLLMVMVHAAATWNPYTTTQISPLAYIISGLGGLAAPLFVSLLGWGLARGQMDWSQRFIRAGFLCFCQGLVNLTSPHLFEFFTPGVLTLMALLILTEPMWMAPLHMKRRSPESVLLFTMAALYVLLEIKSEWQGLSEWGPRVATPNASTFVEHLLITGTYPLIPWFLFAMLGATIALTPSEIQPRKARIALAIGLTTSLLILIDTIRLGQVWALPSGDARLTFFPANGPFLIAATTGSVLLWSVIQRTLAPPALASVGRVSLTIYVAHFIPFYWLHGLAQSQSWSLQTSSFVVMIYTLLWAGFGILWHRKAERYTLESFMRSTEAALALKSP